MFFLIIICLLVFFLYFLVITKRQRSLWVLAQETIIKWNGGVPEARHLILPWVGCTSLWWTHTACQTTAFGICLPAFPKWQCIISIKKKWPLKKDPCWPNRPFCTAFGRRTSQMLLSPRWAWQFEMFPLDSLFWNFSLLINLMESN